MDEYRHFNVLVVGENPEELMLKYDAGLKVEPYVKYEYARAEEYYNSYLKSLRVLLKTMKRDDEDEEDIALLEEEIHDIENMKPEDYYFELTAGCEIDTDSGDAYSRENPDAKFTSHRIAGFFALPFILKDGREVYTAYKGDVDWDKIHLANKRPYEVAWDTVVEGKTPNGEEEHKIYENMKYRTHYFTNFENREHYIAASCAFWNYAYVDENGWVELDKSKPQFDWVINFYDRFIKPLPDNAKLTLYECVRPKDF